MPKGTILNPNWVTPEWAKNLLIEICSKADKRPKNIEPKEISNIPQVKFPIITT